MRIPIKDLVVGNIYWYSTNRGNIQFRVLSAPRYADGGWLALVEYANGKIDDIYRWDAAGDPPIYYTPMYMGVANVAFENIPI